MSTNAAPIPTRTRVMPDWPAVWVDLCAQPPGVPSRPYAATIADTRRFNLWARRHHASDVHYITEAVGVVRFWRSSPRGGPK